MGDEQVVMGQEQGMQPGSVAVEAADPRAETTPEPSESPRSRGRRNSNAQVANLEDLKPGMRFKGKVRNVVDFGAFVDIGVGRDGLAHISVLKQAGIDKTIKVGDVLEVVVRRFDPEDNRISLSLPQARDAKTALRDLQAGTVVTGRVVRLADFGAFVDVGAQTDGLLHVSQLPWGYTNSPSEVLHVGDEISVRILEVDVRKRRISLTMRDTAAEEPQEEQARSEQSETDSRLPTAFEAAFEKARNELRQRQRRPRK